MKRILMSIGLLLGMFAATTLVGCAVQNMDGSMDSSMDTMSEEKMDSGMGSMQGEEMRDMQDNEIEKTME